MKKRYWHLALRVVLTVAAWNTSARSSWYFKYRNWAILLAVGHQLSHAGFHEVQTILSPESLGLDMLSIALAAFLYMIVLALPFVPAIELGILIMGLFGQLGIIIAYMATIGGLSLAFTTARFLPASICNSWNSENRVLIFSILIENIFRADDGRHRFGA